MIVVRKLTYMICFCQITAGVVLGKDRFLPLLPMPQQVEFQSGEFKLQAGKLVIRRAFGGVARLDTAMGELADLLTEATGVAPEFDKAEQLTIWLGIPAENDAFAQLCRQQDAWPNEKLGAQGYVLVIQKRRIIVSARDLPGLFYGLQTLQQLMRGRETADALTCLKITDWPHFRYRGMQDDISRGPVPTFEFMQSQIRRCAELKLNMVSYYTEHVVATESHGDFAPAGGSLSIADWKRLSDYAENYFIEIVPNFQSFGHFEKILSFPAYEHLGESRRLLSPAIEESYDLLRDIYTEMVPAFNSPFFNVNCDETFDLGRGQSKQLVDSLGIARVYINHLKRIDEILRGLGKRTMMWGDIVLSHPEILALLPPDAVIGSWHYSNLDSFDFMLEPLMDSGHDIMISCGVLNSNRIMPDYFMTFGNIKNFTETASRYEVLGVLNTVWDDGGSALFNRDWMGVAYGAEKSWHVQPGPERDFDKRFDYAVYGDRANKIAAVIWQLSALTDLALTQEMSEKIFWTKVIPERDERVSFRLDEWREVLEICRKAEALLDAAEPQRFAGELAVWRLTIAQYRHLAEIRQLLYDAGRAYRDASLNQQQDRVLARSRLRAALDAISAAQVNAIQLRNLYQSTWLLENRMHWLDRILERLDERVQKLANVEELLFAAVSDFDQGHYLPSPGSVRLDIDIIQGNYFQSWLMAGPFENPGDDGYRIDHLQALGGESKARGKVAGEFRGPDGKTYRWRKVTFPKLQECDLAQLYENNTDVLAYAYARINSPEAQQVRATFGSNDGIRVYCNGELLFERHVKRNLMPDEEEVVLPLTEGQNHLLLKIDQGKGGWGFSFRLPDNIVRNHDYKYRLLE